LAAPVCVYYLHMLSVLLRHCSTTGSPSSRSSSAQLISATEVLFYSCVPLLNWVFAYPAGCLASYRAENTLSSGMLTPFFTVPYSGLEQPRWLTLPFPIYILAQSLLPPLLAAFPHAACWIMPWLIHPAVPPALFQLAAHPNPRLDMFLSSDPRHLSDSLAGSDLSL
jgi:hypothetical protein